MKLLNKIFHKKNDRSPVSSPDGGGSGSSGSSSGPAMAKYFSRSSVMSPRTKSVDAAKVLRVLGAENRDQEAQIIKQMEMRAEVDPDSTDVSFEEVEDHRHPESFARPTTPGFFSEHRRSLDSFGDTSSFESRSMSPTPSSRLSPANDPWCRSPQSPLSGNGYSLALAAAAAVTPGNTMTDSSRVPHPLPSRSPPPAAAVCPRAGNSLRTAAPAPLPLPRKSLGCALDFSHRKSSERSPRFSQSPQSPRWSPLHSPQRSPSRLLKCQKLQELGRGSFATVYEGFMEDGSFCAIKVVHDSIMTEETTKEVQLLSQLNHPNIVRYLGACIDETGSLCIFLEHMKSSLKTILNKLGGFEESTIRAYTRQILHGLVYLHENHTIHRDIKCANILVDSLGQVKLADFGVAKQTPLASSLKGTPIFMAPEVVTPNPSKRSYGTAVDIWSLGCTILEMSMGKPPWSDLGFGVYFKLSKGEAPPIPDSLSPIAKDFVQQCLLFNPEDRPKAIELLQHQFVLNAPSSVPSFPTSPLASPRASPIHRQSGARSSLVQDTTHFHPIEGLRRNGNLTMITREDSGFSAVIHRTRLEPQQMIYRTPLNLGREPELQGLVL
ncbi:mitogen-activated protein kinase kinase kinase 3 isoform X2 [Selaginella moellendorffii]|uniref:mitogen-activated protein kinase kinase kinase 3 isoform X2 n=1 Tax=Selaginella moellendorffii TaxID=88036 RepID=UPI000D1C2F59|nr:mitogen-activated protein kinase kinase kinase 3 isoform X2 [Selaginella moellendorffii]|eukprot:XP_024531087.1 mitogen-activated protein kinase kinase kinase 3 isoform X2 [Selaginella moellendorffii]